MSGREWWEQQAGFVKDALTKFRSGEIFINRLADDMMAVSDAFEAEGGESLGESFNLLKAPSVWLEEFRSSAFDIEVIYSLALDEGWEELPSAQVDGLNVAIEKIDDLVATILGGVTDSSE